MIHDPTFLRSQIRISIEIGCFLHYTVEFVGLGNEFCKYGNVFLFVNMSNPVWFFDIRRILGYLDYFKDGEEIELVGLTST